MLPPAMEWHLPSEGPDEIRSLVSRLSHTTGVGIVEILKLGEVDSLVRVHADLLHYTIICGRKFEAVYECLGPRALRLWQKDSDEEVANGLSMLQQNFSEQLLPSFRIFIGCVS